MPFGIKILREPRFEKRRKFLLGERACRATAKLLNQNSDLLLIVRWIRFVFP